MSSPFRGSRSPQTSPTNRWRRSQQYQANGFRPGSSYRESTSSPLRQLAEDLSRVYISDTKAFKLSLDLQDDEREKMHREALVKSLAEHEAVRDSAERARQRVELEIERAKQKLVAEERMRVEEERLKIERDERDRKAREAVRLQQIEGQRKAEEAKAREEETRKRERAQQEERENRRLQEEKEKLAREQQAKKQSEQVEQDRKQAESRAAASKAVSPPDAISRTMPTMQNLLNGATQQAVITAQPSEGWKTLKAVPVLTPQGIVSTSDQREAEHQRYLEMHKRLKEMRQWVSAQAKSVPGLSEQLSEMRRTIKKKLSMFNAVDKTLNRKPTEEIQSILESAAQKTQISIDPASFIVALDDAPQEASNGQYPAVLLFLLNYFAKYVLQRFTDQVGRDPKSAEPYGVLLVTIFGSQTYHYRNHSLIDVLWAKFHKVCPVLFGICGNEKTVAGKHRLGWKFEKDFESTKPGAGSFIGAEEHLGNQAGLATGFAAITLRDFAKSKKQNPAPNYMFWTSMARVLATPPQDRTATHFIVARNMIELYVPRFIHFYGNAAIAALRKLFRDWPREASNKKDPNVLALEGLPRFFERDHQLYL